MPREPPERRTLGSVDLSVVDEAYGDYADLYKDVLQVGESDSPEQVQLAYFDRRSELFTLLAKMDSRPQDDATLRQRMEAEHKMDAVVLAVRVLGDPDQRLQYDKLRPERLRQRKKIAKRTRREQERKNQRKNTNSTTTSTTNSTTQVSKAHRERKSRSSSEVLNQSNYTQETDQDLTDEERTDVRELSMDMYDDQTYDTRQDDGTVTVYTVADVVDEKDSYLGCLSNSRILRKISNEISYACEDTLVSVDQVFNAFTLTDKDIKAVTKRIDKAKKQLDG